MANERYTPPAKPSPANAVRAEVAHDPEVELLAVAQGDLEAFKRLAPGITRELRTTAAEWAGSDLDGRTALFGTLVAMWSNRLKFHGDITQYRHWAKRILRRQVRDQRRGVQRDAEHLVFDGEDHDEVAQDDEASPEALVFRAEDLEFLRVRVRELPFYLRPTMDRLLEGWSFRDIADSKGVSTSVVHDQYKRALEHLKKEFNLREPGTAPAPMSWEDLIFAMIDDMPISPETRLLLDARREVRELQSALRKEQEAHRNTRAELVSAEAYAQYDLDEARKAAQAVEQAYEARIAALERERGERESG